MEPRAKTIRNFVEGKIAKHMIYPFSLVGQIAEHLFHVTRKLCLATCSNRTFRVADPRFQQNYKSFLPLVLHITMRMRYKKYSYLSFDIELCVT